MKPIEVQLLESLASGVRPFDAVPIEDPETGVDFDSMLKSASQGKAKTDLGVVIAPSLAGEFSQSQQERIARAVDLVGAAGIDQALILHEERTLRVDVRNRTVLEAHETSDQQVIDGIDGFVSVRIEPGDVERGDSEQQMHDPTAALGMLKTPARVVRNASLVHALAGSAQTDQ